MIIRQNLRKKGKKRRHKGRSDKQHVLRVSEELLYPFSYAAVGQAHSLVVSALRLVRRSTFALLAHEPIEACSLCTWRP